MTDIEEEVILLLAVKELIDSMVNFELLEILGSDPESEIKFHSATHQKFFNIVLVDFLSQTDPKSPVKQTSYLSALQSISDTPKFDGNGSVTSLKKTTVDFVHWLEKEIEVTTWFPSINKKLNLKISRIEYLKMCGNISKHHYLRAVRVAGDLKKTLEKCSITITSDDALLALADFYERFHSDILNYQASTIAEFLNNIRWGIYEYLHAEYQRSIVRESHEPSIYRYTYPPQIMTDFSKQCYWQLMNEVRNPPYVRRFRVNKFLKLRY